MRQLQPRQVHLVLLPLLLLPLLLPLLLLLLLATCTVLLLLRRSYCCPVVPPHPLTRVASVAWPFRQTPVSSQQLHVARWENAGKVAAH